MFYFNQTSLVGMAANLFLVPLVGFVAVPAGLVSAFVSFFSEPAAALGFQLSVQLLRLATVALDFFSGLTLCRRQYRYALPAGDPSLLPDRMGLAEPAQNDPGPVGTGSGAGHDRRGRTLLVVSTLLASGPQGDGHRCAAGGLHT